MPAANSDHADHRLPEGIEPSAYRIHIDPDLDAGTFVGKVIVDARATADVDEVVLNNDGLVIESATIDGDPVEWSVDATAEQMTLHRSIRAAQEFQIELHYSGAFNTRLVGFYASTYEADGETKVLGTTQFEAPHARKAFPCWDEPAYKATFELSMVVAEGDEVVANTAEVGRQQQTDGSTIVSFAPSMTMSTYLVAWVVGPLGFSETRTVDGVPLRVACRPSQIDQTEFALDAAEFALRYFADYFGVAYPGDKVDLIAIPDFAFGAMENLGCITFRESLLLIDPEQTTQTERQRAVDVIAHELAHMWFGDLVTMKWWNGIWLNEAFATFMEMKCTDAYRPEWNRWADFGISRTEAFATDALSSTRPIEFPVRTPEEAEGMFDILTYEKGAAVVRMLEQHLGEEQFRAGLRIYMDRYAYGNTETTDLWDVIEETAGQPVREMMDGWIFQGGFPLVRVDRTEGGVRLGQDRFHPAGSGATIDPTTWEVPVRYRIGSTGPGDEPRTDSVVLGADPVVIEARPDVPVVVNAEGASFVRVAYPTPMLDDLAARNEGLTEVERYALIDDAWAMVQADEMTTPAFLTLLESMSSERSRAVWRRIIGGLHGLDRLVSAEAEAGFREIAHDILSPALANLGLTPVVDEAELDRQLRGDLVRAMGTVAEDADVQRECQRTVSVGQRDPSLVEPSLMAAAIAVTAHVGDGADFDSFAASYEESSSPQVQLRYLYALADFRTVELVSRLLDMVGDGRIRTQNAAFAILAALRNPVAGETAWEYVTTNWDDLNERLPSGSIKRMLEGVTSLDTPEMVDAVAGFLAAHPLAQAEHTVAQILEQQRINAALRRREADRLSAFVA